jgi:oxygen-independent coproporphyrinogen-3 oxidase
MDTVGLGYAAITFFGDASLENRRSWSYINWRNLLQYKAAINAERFPVECGFSHESEDFQVSMVFRNLFGLELDRGNYRSAFGVDVYDQFEGVWAALEEWGFVRITPDKITLIGDGPFYTPMIQALLAEQRYRDLRERVVHDKAKAAGLPVLS